MLLTWLLVAAGYPEGNPNETPLAKAKRELLAKREEARQKLAAAEARKAEAYTAREQQPLIQEEELARGAIGAAEGQSYQDIMNQEYWEQLEQAKRKSLLGEEEQAREGLEVSGLESETEAFDKQTARTGREADSAEIENKLTSINRVNIIGTEFLETQSLVREFEVPEDWKQNPFVRNLIGEGTPFFFTRHLRHTQDPERGRGHLTNHQLIEYAFGYTDSELLAHSIFAYDMSASDYRNIGNELRAPYDRIPRSFFMYSRSADPIQLTLVPGAIAHIGSAILDDLEKLEDNERKRMHDLIDKGTDDSLMNERMKRILHMRNFLSYVLRTPFKLKSSWNVPSLGTEHTFGTEAYDHDVRTLARLYHRQIIGLQHIPEVFQVPVRTILGEVAKEEEVLAMGRRNEAVPAE